MSKKQYFVTSTGTNTGKTAICCAINNLFAVSSALGGEATRKLDIKPQMIEPKKARPEVANVNCNYDYDCLKPIISGYEFTEDNDLKFILQSLGREYNQKNIEDISLYRYKLPLAPNMAAQQANLPEPDKQHLLDFLQRKMQQSQNLLVEGAGGLYVPINSDYLTIDLITDIKLPVILICPSFLGSISHSLSVIDNLLHRNIEIAAIIINESLPQSDELFIKAEDTEINIKHFMQGNLAKRLDINQESPINDVRFFSIKNADLEFTSQGRDSDVGGNFTVITKLITEILKVNDFQKYFF